jgi:hypothetical protein
MSVGRTLLLAGVAALAMCAASLAHAADKPCELEVKILKSGELHVLEKCDGVETFHADWNHPKGSPRDDAHRCTMESVGRVDASGVLSTPFALPD